MSRSPAELVAAARDDDRQAVLEGLHPLKHALRFGAEVTLVVTEQGCDLRAAAATTAPDLIDRLPSEPHVVDPGTFATLCRRRPPVPVVALAARPRVDAAEVLAGPGRVILLEDPVHLGNVGAVVRVAAAARAAGVLTTGLADPWHPAALRGGAGLQFALPVARAGTLPGHRSPLVAFDPEGQPLSRSAPLPRDAVLAFGTERDGLTPALREQADRVVAIEMRPGVSSLNLATSVAVALYSG